MANINFGILDTQLPGRLAAIPQEAQKQQTANMLQAMQVQGAMRQNEMSQMQLDELKSDRAEMVKLQQAMQAKGGSPDLGQYADMLMRSPKHMQLGIQLKQKLDNQAKFAEAMREEAPVATPGPTNALAPSAAPPANALAVPADPTAAMRQRRNRLIGIDTDQARAAVKSLDADIALASREPAYQNVPGVGLVNPRDKSVVMPSVAAPVRPTGDLAMYEAAVARGYKGTPLDFVREKAAAGRQLRPEAAPRTQQVTMSNGGLGIVNMDTGVITPSTMGGAPVKGKPSAFAEKTALQRAQMGKDLTFAITQLTDITKDGGLIDQSTGSGAGRLTDVAARFVGQALPGDIAIGKIAPIADLALKMVPRFEGPQSNADTKSYNEAAGQLKDSSLPTKIRKEAGKVVLRIMQARKDQFATADMAAEGAPAIGVDASNPLLK